MRTLFYMIGIIPIIWELYVIGNPRKVRTFSDGIRAKGKLVGGKDMLTSTETTFSIFTLMYCIWCIIGLFSSQWVLFGMILLLSLIPKRHFTLSFIDAVITLGLLVFIILNRQHFHIDTLSYIKAYFA